MYKAVLFLHLIGVALLVGAVATTLVATLRVQTAESVAELRSLTAVTKRIEIVIAPAMVLIIASGLYMVFEHGYHRSIPWSAGWLDASVVVTALLAVIGNTVEARDAKRLHTAIADASGESPGAELRQLQLAPRPIYVVFFGTSQVVALLFLMTNRPGLAVAITACAIAAAASGLAASIRNRSVHRVTNQPLVDIDT